MTYKALSLGWGVQSFTLAAMAALGDIERPDVAIHADTTHESKLTYEFAERWSPWLEEHGVTVATVQDAWAAHRLYDGVGQIHAPFYSILNTSPGDGYVSVPVFVDTGKGGQLHRRCTQRWKIAPIRRYVQAHRNRQPVEQWIGISTDEALRMKPSDVRYITNRWPLIELGMSRRDCERYLADHGLEIPPKSACTFCPYHSTAEWRRIKNTPDDWLEAVAVDNVIRKARPPYDLYVHPSRKPLESIDFRTEQEKGQLELWDEECTGLCGV